MNKLLLYGVGGIVLGVGITSFFFSKQITDTNTIQSSTHAPTVTMQHDMTTMHKKQDMTMNDMVTTLKGKMGEDFDIAFISGMIEHHQGAIAMAHEAKKRASHREIKDMADAIISAQTSEIATMKQWQKEWGYDK